MFLDPVLAQTGIAAVGAGITAVTRPLTRTLARSTVEVWASPFSARSRSRGIWGKLSAVGTGSYSQH
jgi:hypothetical protein